MPYWLIQCKTFKKKNFPLPYFDLFFRRRRTILLNFKQYSFRPLCTMPVVKNQRGFWGDFFELFSLKSVKIAFS
jgi:hypothetical protein